jgi:hypothetical protein
MPVPPTSMMLDGGRYAALCNKAVTRPTRPASGRNIGARRKNFRVRGTYFLAYVYAGIAKLKCRCTFSVPHMSRARCEPRRRAFQSASIPARPLLSSTGSFRCHARGMLSFDNGSYDMTRLWLVTIVVGLCLSLAACGGSRAIAQNNGTCGKQLTDLQNAVNSGAMTQSEYQSAREEAIHRCNSD